MISIALEYHPSKSRHESYWYVNLAQGKSIKKSLLQKYIICNTKSLNLRGKWKHVIFLILQIEL